MQTGMDKVDDLELQAALVNRLQGWKKTGQTLERSFELRDFKTALAVVNEVGEKAEDIQHHPDIDIRYNKVKFVLTSHDANGITRRDLILAGYIDEIVARHKDATRAA